MPPVRGLVLAVLVASSAVHADDKKPAVTIQTEQLQQPDHGMVYEPPLLRDALPWPRGMVITPPPTHDNMSTSLPGDVQRLGTWLAGVVDALRSAAQTLL
jgi:hypothetical protein